ncbi:MAG: hypothetical protein GEU96_09640 [Propionibacteriales bacterium]|nr:hypothetical protein [Propionibacteriales bacterium]
MPQYAILQYAPTPGDAQDIPTEEMDAFLRYSDLLQEKGTQILAGHALQSSETATTVRGELVTDGPFLESKEVLAGFCIIEAADLDHALEAAKLNPATWRGAVEVRPILG